VSAWNSNGVKALLNEGNRGFESLITHITTKRAECACILYRIIVFILGTGQGKRPLVLPQEPILLDPEVA
jgi:hypothetical protein